MHVAFVPANGVFEQFPCPKAVEPHRSRVINENGTTMLRHPVVADREIEPEILPFMIVCLDSIACLPRLQELEHVYNLFPNRCRMCFASLRRATSRLPLDR